MLGEVRQSIEHAGIASCWDDIAGQITPDADNPASDPADMKQGPARNTPSGLTDSTGKRQRPRAIPPPRGHPSAEATHMRASLAAHLRRAVLLRRQIDSVHARARLAETVQSIAEAGAVVARSGRVLSVNSAAMTIIDEGEALCLRNGKIGAISPQDERRLYAALEEALSPSGVDPVASVALIRSQSGLPAFAVSFTRLTGEQTGPDGDMLAWMRLAAVVPNVSPSILRRLYGLSPAEAEVALSLSRGANVEDIARDRHRSVLTVRAQLRSIFVKMDVRSQTQMAATIAALSGLVR